MSAVSYSPALERQRAARQASRRRAPRLLIAGFLACTLLQCFAVPVGNYSIPVAVPITYILIFLLLLSGRLRFDVNAFGWFALQFGIVAVSYALSGSGKASASSAAYLIALYAVWIFNFSRATDTFATIKAIQGLHLAFGVLGIVQFCLQFAGGPFLSLYDLFPDVVLKGFHYLNPLKYQSPYYKANGVFFQEPSAFSREMALAILFEIYFLRRKLYLLVFSVALLMAFSGTGIMLLGVGMMFMELRRMRLVVGVLAVTSLLVSATIFAIPTTRAIALHRLGEFSETGGSGYVRFVAPYQAIMLLAKKEGVPIVGKGPGSINNSRVGGFVFAHGDEAVTAIVTHKSESTQAYDTTVAKLIYEYGFVGFLVFLLWSLHRFRQRMPRFLAISQLVSYWLLSGSLLVAQQVFEIFWLQGLLLIPKENRRPGWKLPIERATSGTP